MSRNRSRRSRSACEKQATSSAVPPLASMAAAGIYGVTTHLVSTRTGEIGIHLTLGATPVLVLRQVVGEAALQAALGAVVGMSLALLAARGLGPMLFEVDAWDPATFAGALLAALLIAVLAALIPAIRAMRVDPVTTLRAG